ncbi:MAG: transketolase, partial [Planctomycetota bacterium]|nr:transketolase [Planctomycetota bacterium]
PLEEIKNFRQWGSLTPGHIEYGLTPGVDMTTGPLAQGFAAGVGMAMAERYLAARFNRPGHEIIDHYTYAIVSDGDMEEGLSSEAASLAGTLRLGKLIYLYDKNDISIEGDTAITFTEDVAGRFKACGWQVLGPLDGMDIDAVAGAISEAQAKKDCPSLIICRTHIGYGSPNKQDSAAAHGEPLGEAEARLTKEKLGWDYDQSFVVPETVRDYFRRARERGEAAQAAWRAVFEKYHTAYPELAAQLARELGGELPERWDQALSGLIPADAEPMATREASGKVLNALAGSVPVLIGGSADLAPSNKTRLKDGGDFSADNYCGRNLHFGIREHAMAAACNGMALDGLRPFGATFFVFADYCRPSIRLAAMMKLPVLYVFTHDSIAVGEDGPTHQPIEHLAALRAIPNLIVVRPADANEVAEAYRTLVPLKDQPACLVLTRQNLPTIDREKYASATGVAQGGYILADSEGTPEVILIGTGSEVAICLEAREKLAAEGIAARVVSLPSWELFEAQPQEYRDSVLPPEVTARVGVEMAIEMGWQKYLGQCSQGKGGRFLGMNNFGISGPYQKLLERYGFTADNIAAEAKAAMGR